jgi:hypothetical protein
MNWPPASDYQDAIQTPSICFQDADLRAGQPAVNRLGLPRVASGNFASVYQVRRSAEQWAVRCFLRQGADQQRRYSLLSRYLSSVAMPGLVEFAYLDPGIRVRSQWCPIVKMEWVDGLTLHTFVAAHVHDGARLRGLADQWYGLLGGLRQNGVAHCDLQHGNVLVTPNEQLRLVDYDGMFVPPLKGLPSHELGHPNYQHPRRTAADYDEALDNFSALAIYTAVRALVAEPGLWSKFDTDENLLFLAGDYRAPEQSALFRRLSASPDRAVRTLAACVAGACGGPVDKTPDFRQVVESLPPIPVPEPWWHGVAPPGKTRASPSVPPLPRNTPARQRSEAADAATPWWRRPPKSTFYGIRLGDLLVPAKAAEIVRMRIRLAPVVGRLLRTRAAALPVRDTARRGAGCAAVAGASCLAAVTLTVGFALALQFIAQQLGVWLR